MMPQVADLPAPPTPPPLPQVVVQGPDFFPPPWVTLPPAVTLLVVLGFFAACAVVLHPLMRAVGRRLEGRGAAGDANLVADVEQLRQRMGELEAMQHRVMELEERVDFAERLLSQRREAERLPGSK